MRGHRRLWPRAFLRRWEAAAWAGAAAVVLATAVLVVRSLPTTETATETAGDLTAAAITTPATSGSPVQSSVCIFDYCARPMPTGPPTRVRIASIKVDSLLESLTLDRQGRLNPPVSYTTAGWYARGVIPGDAGPAVIAGHVDSYQGPGVFKKLRTLKPGDIAEVQRGGEWVRFRITVVEEYPKDEFPTEKVYRPTPDPQLRLITCGGPFDRVARSYDDNIVVYAVLA